MNAVFPVSECTLPIIPNGMIADETYGDQCVTCCYGIKMPNGSMICELEDVNALEAAISTEIEDALTRDDCLRWHRGKPTLNVRRLVGRFGPFQIWGVKHNEGGEEPLRVIAHA